MNKAEMKILHGIYFHREMINEPICYSAAELNWLVHASFAQGRQWERDGKLQALKMPHDDYLAQIGATSAAAERPIRYLQSAGYVRWLTGPGFRIAVTVKGADLARTLDSAAGRASFWYTLRKDGILPVLVAAAVSVVVSALTTVLTGYIARHESDSRPTPMTSETSTHGTSQVAQGTPAAKVPAPASH